MELIKIEKRMTISEVSESLNVTPRTIRRYVEKIYPGHMRHGFVTLLNEEQVTVIKLDLEKNKHLDTSVPLPKTELEENLIIQQAQNFL